MTISNMLAALVDVRRLADESQRYLKLDPRIECGTAVVCELKAYARSVNPTVDVDALPLAVFGILLRERDDMEPEAWRVVVGEGTLQP